MLSPLSSILFVCTGNICRSPSAEYLLKSLLKDEKIPGIRVWSRGIAAMEGEAIAEGSVLQLKEAGIEKFTHRAGQLVQQDIDEADLILVMEGYHRDWIEKQFPAAASKMFLLKSYAEEEGPADIADPYGGSPEDYEKCRIEIQRCLLGLLTRLKTHLKEKP